MSKLNIRVIGALTSKPYAFTARSWELTSNESIDFFDSLGSNIRVDTRGSEIMRILPKINNNINEEWISDKIRFSYDGLKQQRLNNPLIKINNEFKVTNWKLALSEISKRLSDTTYMINFIFGNFVDMETQFVAKVLAQRLNGNIFFNNLIKNDIDFSSNYLLNIPLNSLNKIDLFFLVGVNLRLENPVLNLKLRRRVNEGATVITLGNSGFYDYPIINIGNDLHDLIRVAEGKHPVSAKLLKAKNPLVLVGSTIAQRLDSLSIISTLKNINKYFNNNIVSYLSTNLSEVNFMELGFTNNVTKNTNRRKLLYIIGADNVTITKDEDTFIVYQGHHGDRVAEIADVILPGSTPFEKVGTYVNLNGIYQRTKFIHTPPGNSRNDWKILKAIAEVSGIGLEFTNINQLHLTMSKMVTNNVSNGLSSDLYNQTEKKIFNTPILSYIDDYYLNDTILRSSYVMALSSNRFNKKLNFNI